ncbi:MAG: DUF1465 family protein [Sphingomonadales bacterium]
MGPLKPQLDALYRDTAACGVQARHWFDGPCLAWRRTLALPDQARVANEALATTARLMQVMSWLLHPAHGDGATACLPFAAPAEADLPDAHPLAGQPGGAPGAAIARHSRFLVTRTRLLAERFAA